MFQYTYFPTGIVLTDDRVVQCSDDQECLLTTVLMTEHRTVGIKQN